MENKYLKKCEQQAINTITLKAMKMCIDDCPTRDEMAGIYKFLIYLSSENEEIK